MKSTPSLMRCIQFVASQALFVGAPTCCGAAHRHDRTGTAFMTPTICSLSNFVNRITNSRYFVIKWKCVACFRICCHFCGESHRHGKEKRDVLMTKWTEMCKWSQNCVAFHKVCVICDAMFLKCDVRWICHAKAKNVGILWYKIKWCVLNLCWCQKMWDAFHK